MKLIKHNYELLAGKLGHNHREEGVWNNGDCLYMDDILFPYHHDHHRPTSDDDKKLEGREVLHLAYINPNTVRALSRIGCADMAAQLAKYNCPYTGRDYYWAVPLTILAKKGSELYNAYAAYFKDNWQGKMAMDTEWNAKRMGMDQDIWAALLGPGYTEGTSMYDGGGSIEDACAYTEGGDIILFKTHVWYNK